jgi:hypothetical protein
MTKLNIKKDGQLLATLDETTGEETITEAWRAKSGGKTKDDIEPDNNGARPGEPHPARSARITESDSNRGAADGAE